jgi:hypothetical protein
MNPFSGDKDFNLTPLGMPQEVMPWKNYVSSFASDWTSSHSPAFTIGWRSLADMSNPMVVSTMDSFDSMINEIRCGGIRKGTRVIALPATSKAHDTSFVKGKISSVRIDYDNKSVRICIVTDSNETIEIKPLSIILEK